MIISGRGGPTKVQGKWRDGDYIAIVTEGNMQNSTRLLTYPRSDFDTAWKPRLSASK